MGRAEGSKTMSIHISKSDMIDQEIYNYYYANKSNRSRIKAILYQHMIMEKAKIFNGINYSYDLGCNYSDNPNDNSSDSSSDNHSKNQSDNSNDNYSSNSSNNNSKNYGDKKSDNHNSNDNHSDESIEDIDLDAIDFDALEFDDDEEVESNETIEIDISNLTRQAIK